MIDDKTLATIPEEKAQELIEAASELSGRPASELTTADAIQILMENGFTIPQTKAESLAAILWANMTMKQASRIVTADPADLTAAFLSVVEEIAQQAQEPNEVIDDSTQRMILLSLPVYNPKTDPISHDFDIDTLKAAIVAAGKAIRDQISNKFSEALSTEKTNSREIGRVAAAFINDLLSSDEYKAIKSGLDRLSAYLKTKQEELSFLEDAGDQIKKLAPFLQMELEEAQEDPAFANCSLSEVIQNGIDEDGNPIKSKFMGIVDRAIKQLNEYEKAQETIAKIESVIAKPAEKIDYPLDKVNSTIWNIMSDSDKNGQMALLINSSKNGSNPDTLIYYSIDFDDLGEDVKITKQPTPFDKRCYAAAAALFCAGNELFSATQLYRMMGFTGTPGLDDLQKVNDCLTKMGKAWVSIDNVKETETATGYPHFIYEGSLLPFERVSAYINGKFTNSAIHLFREPPLVSFARERNQITTISRHLLESPISKTDANLRIEDYLLERIGHMKNPKGKAPHKMLFSTIYEHCGIKTAKQKQRAPQKIRKYLDFYKKQGWIKGYSEATDGITIQL